jgi:Pectinacetylesterase
MDAHRIELAGLAACVMLTGALGAGCTAPGTPPSSPRSSPVTSEPSQQPTGQLEAFAECMRDHGIAGFPDPSGDGIDLSGTGIDVDSPAFKTAQRACEETLPPPQAGPTRTNEPTAPGWEQVVAGGDCACSDGSEFSFWVRKANPKKVLLYFQAGGACFSAELCDPESDIYRTTVGGVPPGASGVFDFADKRNPFADYSVVYVPYCTGDAFLGSATTTYRPDLTIHHKGYVNGTAALDYLASTFPDATEVVVAGESAGSVAAPLYGGVASDRLPDAKVTVLADGSGSYPDLPDLNARLAAAWGIDDAIQALTGNAGTTTEQWSIPGLFTLSGQHHPDIVFARHDYAYDGRQAAWYPWVDIPVGDLLSRIDANENQIEGSGVNLRSYTAPGDEHTTLSEDRFYTETVNGQTLVAWVAGLIHGEPVDDVRCTECRN